MKEASLILHSKDWKPQLKQPPRGSVQNEKLNLESRSADSPTGSPFKLVSGQLKPAKGHLLPAAPRDVLPKTPARAPASSKQAQKSKRCLQNKARTPLVTRVLQAGINAMIVTAENKFVYVWQLPENIGRGRGVCTAQQHLCELISHIADGKPAADWDSRRWPVWLRRTWRRQGRRKKKKHVLTVTAQNDILEMSDAQQMRNRADF